MWLDKQVSFYECAADNTGTVATFRDILFGLRFAVPHRYYYKDYTVDKKIYPKGIWISDTANDLHTIVKLRKGVTQEEKTTLKQTMQCYTPAGLLKTKKKKAIEEINRTGIMQLDFDYAAIHEYDVEELKKCVFSLDFIAFCALSTGGKGFYAFALIDDPYRLEQYAEHCFRVFLDYGIKADTSKGRNVQDLRFVSWDGNMLIRTDPKPLQVKHFRKLKQPVKKINIPTGVTIDSDNLIVKSELNRLSTVQVGYRWPTVQHVAYTLGGLVGDQSILATIHGIIDSNTAFTNEEEKYKQCATDCFKDGVAKPLIIETSK